MAGKVSVVRRTLERQDGHHMRKHAPGGCGASGAAAWQYLEVGVERAVAG